MDRQRGRARDPASSARGIRFESGGEEIMTSQVLQAVFAATLAAALSGPLAAAPVIDPVGDFLPSYVASGRPTGADLDVVSSEVVYLPSAHRFLFTATMAGAIGTTPASGGEAPLYVWGIDRGAGTERFVAGSPSVGDGVSFDSVLLLRGDGSGALNRLVGGGSTPFAAGFASIAGATISALVDEALLPSLGKAFDSYTWNLWPRFGAGNNAQISDFAPNEAAGAPDAANARVSVPEPPILALLAAALLPLVGRTRRKSAGHAARAFA
jgi:hypothetical protein